MLLNYLILNRIIFNFVIFKPKRMAHPVIKFKCDPSEPFLMEEIPFDKYELEPSPLTQFFLERRQVNVAWQCFIPNSGPKLNDLGYPFGYLKTSSNLMSVCLYVLPYNYPVLFQLMSKNGFLLSIRLNKIILFSNALNYLRRIVSNPKIETYEIMVRKI
jgi:hypothetical protein